MGIRVFLPHQCVGKGSFLFCITFRNHMLGIEIYPACVNAYSQLLSDKVLRANTCKPSVQLFMFSGAM